MEAAACEARVLGETYEAIGRMLGVSRSTARRLCRSVGVTGVDAEHVFGFNGGVLFFIPWTTMRVFAFSNPGAPHAGTHARLYAEARALAESAGLLRWNVRAGRAHEEVFATRGQAEEELPRIRDALELDAAEGRSLPYDDVRLVALYPDGMDAVVDDGTEWRRRQRSARGA